MALAGRAAAGLAGRSGRRAGSAEWQSTPELPRDASQPSAGRSVSARCCTRVAAQHLRCITCNTPPRVRDHPLAGASRRRARGAVDAVSPGLARSFRDAGVGASTPGRETGGRDAERPGTRLAVNQVERRRSASRGRTDGHRGAATGTPRRRHDAATLYHIENPEVDNKAERFLNAFAAVLHYTDYKALLDSYCASSAKCGRCVASCQIYQVSRDPRDIPCYRSNLLLDVYRRHFTAGWLAEAHVGGGWSLTDDLVDEMADVFYRCTACRRCTLECPLGIDHGLITRLGRYILSMAGIAPKALQVSVREQLEGETHNTSKLPEPALVDTLEFLAEEMEESLGVKLEFPLDQPDREYVFFCAVSDYLMEPDTLMGNAAVLYAAGDWDRWTIGTGNFDAINYGLFYSDWHLERIIKQLVGEAKRLRAGDAPDRRVRARLALGLPVRPGLRRPGRAAR